MSRRFRAHIPRKDRSGQGPMTLVNRCQKQQPRAHTLGPRKGNNKCWYLENRRWLGCKSKCKVQLTYISAMLGLGKLALISYLAVGLCISGRQSAVIVWSLQDQHYWAGSHHHHHRSWVLLLNHSYLWDETVIFNNGRLPFCLSTCVSDPSFQEFFMRLSEFD